MLPSKRDPYAPVARRSKPIKRLDPTAVVGLGTELSMGGRRVRPSTASSMTFAALLTPSLGERCSKVLPGFVHPTTR